MRLEACSYGSEAGYPSPAVTNVMRRRDRALTGWPNRLKTAARGENGWSPRALAQLPGAPLLPPTPPMSIPARSCRHDNRGIAPAGGPVNGRTAGGHSWDGLDEDWSRVG